MQILHFAPLPWAELQRNGYRKTAGAMFRALWDRAEVHKLWYVQMDRRWGFQVKQYRVDDKVEVIGLPIGLPFERFAPIRSANRKFQAELLVRITHLNAVSQDARIYWFYDWRGIDLICRLPRGTRVMELTDSAEQFYACSSAALKELPSLRSQAQAHADFAFAVSPKLTEELQGGKCQVVTIPNGISREFLRLAVASHVEPNELSELAHPRLCVVATQWSMNRRVDHELLLQVLRQLEDWSLVLIGCESIETIGLRKLASLPRVRIVNMVPQERLVSFIQHCDVCAVPYIQGPARGDALKTYEYLACSKPVILTADEVTPELLPFVRRATDAQAFAKLCREMVSSHKSQFGEGARDILEGMTWDRRAERCLEIIRQRYV